MTNPIPADPQRRRITRDEFIAEGKKRFGDDPKNWKFRCPRCKTTQTAHDLVEAGVKKEEIDNYLGFSCIGRFTKDKGCNWTLGGLFQIHELEVEFVGEVYRRFEFADE